MEDSFDDIARPIRTGKLKHREALRPFASVKPAKCDAAGMLTPKKGINLTNSRNLASGRFELKARQIGETTSLYSPKNIGDNSELDDSLVLDDLVGKQSFTDYVQEETFLNRSQQACTTLASSRGENLEGSYKQTAVDVFEETMSQKLQKEFLSTSNPRFRLNSPTRPRLATMAQRAGSYFNCC